MSLGDEEAAQQPGDVAGEELRTQSFTDSLLSHCIARTERKTRDRKS